MARTKDFDEDEVVKKAMLLFWHKGYNGTSMQDLVDAMGISRSSIYDTFGDKHTLFMRALENYRKVAAGEMEAITNNTSSAKEMIRKMFEYAVFELLRDDQHKGCFIVNAAVEMAPHDLQINKMLCENDRQLENFFNEAIKKGQSSGEISKHQNSHALAQFVLNSIKGMRVTAKSGADKSVFKGIVDVTMSALD